MLAPMIDDKIFSLFVAISHRTDRLGARKEKRRRRGTSGELSVTDNSKTICHTNLYRNENAPNDERKNAAEEGTKTPRNNSRWVRAVIFFTASS